MIELLIGEVYTFHGFKIVLRDATIKCRQETYEVTTIGDSVRRYIPGLTSYEVTIEVVALERIAPATDHLEHTEQIKIVRRGILFE